MPEFLPVKCVMPEGRPTDDVEDESVELESESLDELELPELPVLSDEPELLESVLTLLLDEVLLETDEDDVAVA